MSSEYADAHPSKPDIRNEQLAELRQNLRRKLRALTWEWSEMCRLADALNRDLDDFGSDSREQRQR